jgi:hypothetical protein
MAVDAMLGVHALTAVSGAYASRAQGDSSESNTRRSFLGAFFIVTLVTRAYWVGCLTHLPVRFAPVKGGCFDT